MASPQITPFGTFILKSDVEMYGHGLGHFKTSSCWSFSSPCVVLGFSFLPFHMFKGTMLPVGSLLYRYIYLRKEC